MKFNKKTSYVAPETFVVSVSVGNMLNASFSQTSFPQTRRDFCLETLCPFNNKWCADKQKRLDAWREAVRTLAKKHIDKTFFMSKNMFIRCPNGYRVLCAQYKQRQRG